MSGKRAAASPRAFHGLSMSQITSGLRAALSLPSVYDFV
jgi:hypothetical protein